MQSNFEAQKLKTAKRKVSSRYDDAKEKLDILDRYFAKNDQSWWQKIKMMIFGLRRRRRRQ